MSDHYFVNGLKIRVINNEKYVKYIQTSCGGWDENMKECINQICEVIKVDLDKTIKIMSPSKKKWFFNRAALEPADDNDYNFINPSLMSTINAISEKIPQQLNNNQNQKEILRNGSFNLSTSTADVQHTKPPEKKTSNSLTKEFKVGDILRVSSNEKLIQEKQQDCGGYSKMRMRDLIGKLVYVKHFSVKCVKVEKDGRDYDLHPDILDYLSPMDEVKSASKAKENIKNKVQDTNVPERNTQFFSAIVNGDIDKLFELIDMDVLDIQNHVGRTPINLACCLGELEMVEKLITFGADIDISDNHGHFPVHNCAVNGHIDILKLILETFPDHLNKKTNNGLSLMNIAKQKRNKELEKYLLEKNIDFSNEIIQPTFQRSLAISLLTPPTTITTNNYDNDLNSTIDYQISNTSSSLMDPPRDESILLSIPSTIQVLNTPQNLQEYDTIKVPSVSNLRNSISDSMQQSLSGSPPRDNECTICRDGPMNIAFVKCGHLACKRCADRIFKCHICNAEIENRMIIYF